MRRGAPGAWEALGEFLHARGRSKEAVAAWSGIAAPPADNPTNWHRLAEVLDHFGYLTDARARVCQGLGRCADNFDYHDLECRLALKAKDYDKAISAVDHLERLAARPQPDRDGLARRGSTWPRRRAGSIARSGGCSGARPRRRSRRTTHGSWACF